MPTIEDYKSDAAYEETADRIRADIRGWTHPLGAIVVGTTTDGKWISGPTTSEPHEKFPCAVIDVGSVEDVPLYRLSLAYGVWGGAGPGGWCHLSSGDGLELHRDRPYEGTRAQAERTAKALRTEYPKLKYEVLPLDPDKEPPAKVEGLSPAQIRALKIIERGRNTWAPKALGGYTKATYVSLVDRGLIVDELTLAPRMRLTRAAKALLAVKERAP